MRRTASQFYIRNNKNHHQINQKCGGFRCRGQPQLYIHNNKNDRQIKKCSEQLHNLHWQQSEHSLNKSKIWWILLHWTASQFYICNNKNDHQINQKCSGFRCKETDAIINL